MSDTPRTDAWKWSGGDDPIGEFYKFACQLERELNEARTRIKELEEALSLFIVNCDNLHHSKKHQHGFHDPCPVVDLILDAKETKS